MSVRKLRGIPVRVNDALHAIPNADSVCVCRCVFAGRRCIRPGLSALQRAHAGCVLVCVGEVCAEQLCDQSRAKRTFMWASSYSRPKIGC